MKKQKITQAAAARRLAKIARRKRRKPSAVIFATDTNIKNIYNAVFTAIIGR